MNGEYYIEDEEIEDSENFDELENLPDEIILDLRDFDDEEN